MKLVLLLFFMGFVLCGDSHSSSAEEAQSSDESAGGDNHPTSVEEAPPSGESEGGGDGGTGVDMDDPNYYCANKIASFPKNAFTSFEPKDKIDSRGQWHNAYPTRAMRMFKIHTPSKSNSEDEGAPASPPENKGESYLYYNSTAPNARAAQFMRVGDRAIFISPGELSGCFCFTFWCYMKTDGKARLRLYTTTSDVIFDTNQPMPEWTSQSLTINLGKRTAALAFEAVRGDTTNSDIALDAFSFKKGSC